VLEEVPGVFGGELFQFASDLALWAEADRSQLSGLFQPFRYEPESSTPPELRTALRIMGDLVARPDSARSEDVSRACTVLREWAERSGYAETSLRFAELAAVCDPENPIPAVAVGKALRQEARYGRARRWFDRAVGVARFKGDHQTMVEAYLGAGILEERTGAHPRAMNLFRRAYRAAKRYRFRELGAAAHHNAMGSCAQTRRFEDALSHAEAALSLYGPTHETIPSLSHDVGQLFSTQGMFYLALDVFRAAFPMISTPAERFVMKANMTRAAAGAGDRDAFLHAWTEIERMDIREQEYTAEALLAIGQGAQMLGFRTTARELGDAALDIATRRGERSTVAEAEELLRRNRDSSSTVSATEPSDRQRALASRLLRILAAAQR
jgi:tetratricopeptide (TPR) repeat protein